MIANVKKVKDVGVLRIMKLRKQDYRRISARRILYMVLIHMENLHYVIFLKMFQMMQQIVFKKDLPYQMERIKIL